MAPQANLVCGLLQSAGIPCHREHQFGLNLACVCCSNIREMPTFKALIQTFALQGTPFLLQNVAVKKVRPLNISAFIACHGKH
jgi:hypothetical protein